MNQSKKTIFITGAGGFIGKNLTNGLSNKYKLLTPNHSELDLLNKISVQNYFKKHSIDTVIHCAVVGGSRPEEHVSSALSQNLRMFINIVNNQQYFRKFIQLGSGAEYDKSRAMIDIKETAFGTNIPSDDYGLFKYLCSKYLESSIVKNFVCLRIFGIYGKYEDYRYRFISNAICKNVLGMPITIGQNVYFNYLYIDDFVEIVEHFITHNSSHKIYNIGSSRKTDIFSIAKMINSIADEKSKIIINRRGLNSEYTCDNTRLIQEIPWLKFKNLEEGIGELYQWYKKTKDSICI